MVAGQDPHHLAALDVDADVGAQRVHHVDRLGLAELPGPGGEGVGLGGQRPDRAEVDHVALQLGGQHPPEIGGDLAVLAAPGLAHLGHARDLGEEAHAAGAGDAAGHAGGDQRPEVGVDRRPLRLAVAAEVDPVGHRLVLQVALAALVADRAVERVVDQQELHHPLARLLDHRRAGPDLAAARPRARGAGRSPASRRRRRASAGRPPPRPGTCGSCRRSTAARGSRTAGSRRPAISQACSSVSRGSTSIAIPSMMSLRRSVIHRPSLRRRLAIGLSPVSRRPTVRSAVAAARRGARSDVADPPRDRPTPTAWTSSCSACRASLLIAPTPPRSRRSSSSARAAPP